MRVNGRQPTSQRAWVLPVLAVLVIGAGAGAGFGVRALDAGPVTAAPVTTAPSLTTTTGPPPGPGIVQLSQDATAHPQADPIRSLLQRHFDAINNRDYAAWASTVVGKRSREMSESKWLAEYVSTRDGNILVHRIEPGKDNTIVLLSFTSTQDQAQAPTSLPGSTCTNWWVSYRVVVEKGQRRIDAGIRHTSLNANCTSS
jgi:hypothetical protein